MHLQTKAQEMRRLWRRTREGCGFSSLVKQKIKGKLCFVIYITGKSFFFIYAVIVKQFFYKPNPLITTWRWSPNSSIAKCLHVHVWCWSLLRCGMGIPSVGSCSKFDGEVRIKFD